jgi:hypothetical protein
MSAWAPVRCFNRVFTLRILNVGHPHAGYLVSGGSCNGSGIASWEGAVEVFLWVGHAPRQVADDSIPYADAQGTFFLFFFFFFLVRLFCGRCGCGAMRGTNRNASLGVAHALAGSRLRRQN